MSGAIKVKSAGFVAVVASIASAASAAPYTNTWDAAEGLFSTWNWGDSANWSVAYGGDTPAPASNVPTEDSVTYLNKTANITLQSGDDWHLGETYFLGTVWDRTLNVSISAGAKLSLDGTDVTSHIGSFKYRNASENNKTTIDVNGGELVLGQKEVRMRANQKGAYNNPTVNHFTIRNGGTISLTNGCWRIFGGSSAESDGKGNFTNVIDVLPSSTLKISQKGRLQFGDLAVRTGHALQQYNAGGYLNVKGGKVDCTECENDVAIGVAGHANASYGTYVTVSDNGEMDFGGKKMSINTANTNILRVTSGGSVKRLGDFHVSWGGYNKASYHNMIDVDGGSVEMDSYRPGTQSGGSNGRTTFRIHGWTGYSRLAMGGTTGCVGWYYTGSGTAPWFLDCRLAPHTPRAVRFPMAPLAITRNSYDTIAGVANGDVKSIHGINRISPDGGFQLVHKKKFEMVVRRHDSAGNFTYASSYRFIGEDMWTNTVGQIGSGTDQEVKDLVGYTYGYAYFAELKDEARLADGQRLATPRPRAWLPLPEFSARQINPGKTMRISVRLDLVAPESGTLDLDKIVRNMHENGWPEASADESVAGYNVRVDLPMDELQANTQSDSIVMDFVEVNDYQQANGLVPFTTNALIRAATCEMIPIIRGTKIVIQ